MSRPASQPVVSVDRLVKRYDGRSVVDGLSFDVERGEVFALLGPNGAGKTTTVEILEGYRRADGGSVTVLGLEPARASEALHRRVGLMLQGGSLYPQARPIEILRLFARFHAAPHAPDDLLELVGLADAARTRYRVLSGGQRQRLGLAIALIGRPELVFLDEPTAGMDPAAKATTRNLIADLRSAGVTVIMTTHELDDVERLADRVAVVVRGRLVALGPPDALTGESRRGISVRLDRPISADERSAIATSIGHRAMVRADDSMRLTISGPASTPETVEAIATACRAVGALIVELRTGGGTLEERYLELVGSDRFTDASAGAAR